MAGSLAAQHGTFFYNLRKYGFKLSKEELKQIIIAVLIIAFIWSFNKWGDQEFNFIEGIKNFILGAVFAFIGLVFNQIGQRVGATYYGYDPIFESGMMGLMIGVVITFASRGLLIFFFPGAINLRHLAASRLGEFRYYTNDWEWAKIGFLGVAGNITLAALLSFFKDIPIMRQLMIMNIMFAFFALVPLPGNLGLYLFYPHIYFWSFVLGFVIAGSLMCFFLNPFLTLFLSLLIGFVFMYYHYVKIDENMKVM